MIIRPGHNALDRQLLLRPCDYAIDPHRFGIDPRLGFRIPKGGNRQSLRAAVVQHLLIVHWRQLDERSGAALARRWSCSRQTVSRTVLGQRWAGHLLQAALIEPLLPWLPRT